MIFLIVNSKMTSTEMTLASKVYRISLWFFNCFFCRIYIVNFTKKMMQRAVCFKRDTEHDGEANLDRSISSKRTIPMEDAQPNKYSVVQLCVLACTHTHAEFMMTDLHSRWKYAIFGDFYKNVIDGWMDQQTDGRTNPLKTEDNIGVLEIYWPIPHKCPKTRKNVLSKKDKSLCNIRDKIIFRLARILYCCMNIFNFTINVFRCVLASL